VGGSTAGRIIQCPPSRLLAEKAPPKPETQYMRNGTILHEAMEMYLEGVPTAEIQNHLREDLEEKFVEACRVWDLIRSDKTIVAVATEVTMDLKPIPGAFGTADVIIEHSDNRVQIIDWKFGDGVQVSADSAQNKFYAAAAMTEFPHLFNRDTKIILRIIQPSDRGETLRSYKTDTLEIFDFMCNLRWAVKHPEIENMHAGEHCRWCPAKVECPELKRIGALALEWEDPHEMTPEQVSASLGMADQLEQWIKAVRDYAHERLDAGQTVDGYKLVARRANRSWVDERAVEQWAKLIDVDIHTHKLKSPAQVEKLVSEVPNSLWHKKPSGTTIAPVDDPREDAARAANLLRLEQQLKT
jgi:hypothetical protein